MQAAPDGDPCSICLEPLEAHHAFFVTQCCHMFHESCVQKMIHHAHHHFQPHVRCPLCQRNICTLLYRVRVVFPHRHGIDERTMQHIVRIMRDDEEPLGILTWGLCGSFLITVALLLTGLYMWFTTARP